MDRQRSRFDHEWRAAISDYYPTLEVDERRKLGFMYEAHSAFSETPRITKLFKMERTNTLPIIHRSCQRSLAEPIRSNYLTCCLGSKTKECPYLRALERIEKCTPDEIDTAKAWTCIAHILASGGDYAGEGYILTVDDRMYWDNVYASMETSTENKE